MRNWIAIALLSGSWLFGLGYFGAANSFVWFCTLAASVLLLADVPIRFSGRGERGIALFLLTPAVWFVPWPYKGIPALLLLGILISLVPIPSRWPRQLGRGSVVAGLLLVPQSVVLLLYQQMTARAHELPGLLAGPFGYLVRLLGADTAIDNSAVVIRDASVTDRIAATWELLLDPGTVSFLVGAVTLMVVGACWTRRRVVTRSSLLKGVLALGALTLVWLPLRSSLLITLVLQQHLRADSVTAPNVGEILVSSWVQLALLILFALTASALIPLRHRHSPVGTPSRARGSNVRARWRQRGSAAVACGLAVAVSAFLYFWVPVGQRKAGRVKVVERHSTWEPTTEPYGTKVYGEAGSYNYAAIYNYCEQCYQMSRLLESDAMDDASLGDCDVLIIKTPTSRYSRDEVEAVVRFVEQGGSLLMIGDHTNVFNMNTYLNDVSRRFGFTFRNDLLFRIGDPYRQAYTRPKISHPVLQHVPPMYFAVSCSIDPGPNPGAMVIRNTGLWNLPPAYHESNYHPQAEYRPNMQYGAWCQMWSTTYGKGRVLAFADSTLFSNFCVYQPGKSELFVGMVEWLNHTSSLDSRANQRWLRILAVMASLFVVVVVVWQLRSREGEWLVVISAGWAGWTIAALAVVGVHHRTMPRPSKHKSLAHVVIDRTVSKVPLFTGAFADDEEGAGYGMLEQWIPRIGNYISRRTGEDVFQGDAIVVFCPTHLPSRLYRDQLVNWVEAGGHLLVFDTPDVENSTANSLLMLFELASIRDTTELEGVPLRLADGSHQTPLNMSCRIEGGRPIALWGEAPVAATIQFGKGSVTAVGFGSLFNDANMGYHWLPEPDEELIGRYEVLYGLLRAGLQ